MRALDIPHEVGREERETKGCCTSLLAYHCAFET